MDTSTQKKAVRLFTIAICLIAVALGLSSANYANYFKEAYNVTSAQRGFIEIPRETPGILCAVIISALAGFSDVTVSILSQVLFVVGLIVMGCFSPGYGLMLVCLFIISVIWGLTQGIVGTFAEGDEFHMAKSLLLAGGGIGAITLSMAVTSSPSEALTLYKPVIPAMVAGIVLLLLQPAVYPFLGSGLIIMGVYCLDMLLMLVSTDIAFRGRIPVALSFGVAILATRAGTLVGSVVADGFLFAPFWTAQLRTDICLVAVLLLAIIGMLFFTMADVQRLYVTPRAQRTDESLEQKCAAVAAMGHLTNRESEVLVLLARGRSVPYICDELSIAQGTVKHHVSNIYRKLGVYDRQGLLDAIEQGGVGRSALA